MKKILLIFAIVSCAFLLILSLLPSIECHKSIDRAVIYITVSSVLPILAMAGLLVVPKIEQPYRIAMLIIIILSVYRLISAIDDLYICYEFYLKGG